MSDRKKQLFAIFFVYIVGVFFFYGSFSMVKDAGLFPRLISIVLLALNTIYLLNVFLDKAFIKKRKDEIIPQKMVYILIASFGYVALVKFLGYILVTSIYLPVAMYLLGIKRLKTLFLVTFFTVVAIYISFGIILKVPMPKGFLGI